MPLPRPIFFLLFVLTLIPFMVSCGGPGKRTKKNIPPVQPPAASPAPDREKPRPSKTPAVRQPVAKKKPFIRITPGENIKRIKSPAETVSIDGKTYPVPREWLGQRLHTPPLKKPDLVPIPTEFAKNSGRIYILKEARDALVAMATAAKKDDIILKVDSGYRSAWYQREIFKRRLAKGHSFEEIVRSVAPPGYSEHMLGTVVDFSPGNWRFAETPAYQWLKQHGPEYGFTESYQQNNPYHAWESWHWRYRKTQ